MSKELAKAKTPENNDKANDMKAVMDKVDKLSNVIGFLQRKLETMFGTDFNGDGKIGGVKVLALAGILAVGLVAGSVFALSPVSDPMVQYADSTGSNYVYTLDTDGNVNAAGSISGVPASSGSVTSSITTVVATESYSQSEKTILVGTDVPFNITSSAEGDAHASLKIYDFKLGRLLVEGVVVRDMQISTGINITNTGGGDFSFGTVAASTNVLTSTMVDLCPSTSIDTLTNIVDSALSASAQFDGRTTAKDMYVNWGIDHGDTTAATVSTNTISFEIEITSKNLGL